MVIPSAEAVYVYAGRLEDGTQVVRDSGGVLHALVAVKRACQEKQLARITGHDYFPGYRVPLVPFPPALR